MPAKKPTALKAIEGFRGHRTKAELDKQYREPRPRPVAPAMPPWLDRYARRRWRELVDDLVAVGVVTIVDGEILGAYCDACSRLRRADAELRTGGWVKVTRTGFEAPSPWTTIRNRALDDMRKFGAELGIGAVARTHVEIKPDTREENPLEVLIAARKAADAERREWIDAHPAEVARNDYSRAPWNRPERKRTS